MRIRLVFVILQDKSHDMINPLFKSYEEQAKDKFKPPVNAVDIVKFYKQKAKELYEASLKEAETKEDEDEVELVNVPEEAPICSKEQEYREYLRTTPISRKVDKIFVHCAATQPTATVTSIERYWRSIGWKNPGYHVLVATDGANIMAHFDVVCNGVKGHNSTSIHVSYVGGIDKNGKPLDTRNDLQKKYIEIFLEEMTKRFPNVKVAGHNEASSKACPSFKVKDVYPNYWKSL